MKNRYVALLRGINVSGQKKIKMADLRVVLEEAGLKHVQTYIQSGNIVFESAEHNESQLEQLINSVIQKHYGFEVPTLVLSVTNFDAILHANPFLGREEDHKLYFVMLKQKPKTEQISAFNQSKFDHEDFHVTDNCVYLLCKNGYGKAKLNNNLIEKKLMVEATTRNLKTMHKLLNMAQSN